MQEVVLQQTKPQQVKITAFILLVLTPILWYYNENSIEKVLTVLFIAILMLGYSVSYKIKSDFDNYKVINVFKVPLWNQRKAFIFPDYISVFSASYKKDNEWGAVSALGTKSKTQNVVIKFFSNRANEIVYKSNSYEDVLEKANELSKLLNVRIHDSVKNSST